MAGLAFDVTTWQGLSQRDQTILRYLSAVLTLGKPNRYADQTANEWFVFADGRFGLTHLAYLGCVISNRDEIPVDYEIPTSDGVNEDLNQMRQDIRAFCENPARTNPLVLPADITYPENDPNPWQTTLDAQNAPQAAIRAAGAVPDSWTETAGGPT